MTTDFNPQTDLLLERTVDVAPELIWAAWTQPEHLKKWFTPAPWKTVDCQIDLRPGGAFSTTMRSPEGQEFPNTGCYLEIIENKKLVWTGALAPGFRPVTIASEVPVFTAVISLEPHGSGTKYSALAMHRDEAGREAHETMGFHEGWGAAFDQLVAMVKAL
jgi:uncharacterized protein YndB with AHSA1/START domain